MIDPPFGTPIAISELNTASAEDDPAVSLDQLEIVFTSSRAGGMGGSDIWTSARANASDPWQAPRNVSELNTPNNESTAQMSADRLTLVYGSGPGGDQDLWIATRTSPAALWSTPTRLATLSTGGFNDLAASLTDTLDAIYFSSSRTGNVDLYTARGSMGSWGTPSMISELNSAAIETSPYIMVDETVLWFASARSGTVGGQDIWVATRPTASAAFDPPTPIGELETVNDDSDPCLSSDGHIIYFSRNGANGSELMMATR